MYSGLLERDVVIQLISIFFLKNHEIELDKLSKEFYQYK